LIERANTSALGTAYTNGGSVYQPTKDAVDFIASYMNENQADALTDIARAHGFAAEKAEIVNITATELTLRIAEAGETASIAWPAPLERREDIRSYLLEMQESARWV
jgi:CheY-specific phosphatase CheX